MGKLIEQKISALYQGVSRQPDSVRLSGQMEAADNAVMSVVSGGFAKRPGTRHIAEITGLPASFKVYGYERDNEEQYLTFWSSSGVKVFDLSGNEKTVYFGETEVTLLDAVTSTSTGSSNTLDLPSGVTTMVIESSGITTATVVFEGSATGAFSGEEVTIATHTTDTTATVTAYAYVRARCTAYTSGTITATTTYQDTTYAYLSSSDPVADYSHVTIGDFTIVANGSITAAMGPAGSDTIHSYVVEFSDLPSTPVNGQIRGVTGESTLYDDYYVIGDTGLDTWTETVNPTLKNSFDVDTMPHQLVRESDGSFTFEFIDWKSRTVGDNLTVPEPDFIGGTISEVTFFRNRLGLISGETLYWGEDGDYFDFWPREATQVNDSDPFGITASSTQVNNLDYAIPFRKTLFATSPQAQFEATGEPLFRAKDARIDLSTAYRTESQCRPFVLGDNLYFAATIGNETAIFEYFFDDNTISNTADNVTLHVTGYVPAPAVQLAGDTVTNTLFVRTDGDKRRLYCYRLHWQGDDKAQSAWFRWDFGEGVEILHAQYMKDELYLVLKRGTKILLEAVRTSHLTPNDDDMDFLMCLDRRESVTGVYNSGTNETTWTLDYEHDDDVVVVLSDDFAASNNVGDQLTVTYPSATTVKATGDYSAGKAIIGINYDMTVTLSKFFMREQDQTTISNGRLQVRHLLIDYEDTGGFNVVVTPKARSAKTWRFTGRVLGSVDNVIGSTPIASAGTYKARINSDGSTCTVSITNNTWVPCVITRITMVGYFNEITRQG